MEDENVEFDTEETATVNSKKKKSGGFQSMGLSYPVLKGVIKKGYKVPTPVQRKCIPVILEGRDVVAMARTGSGKTACFLIPMFEKLQTKSTKGARALILSPTRELALQTLKFTKELGRFAGLKIATILGGESMEAQFAAIHESPDIIVATPGRFAHLCIEMELKLKEIQYVVFDEADRLFEMGFGEQLHQILKRLPERRQTLLFSATMPKLLVDFTQAGLNDPTFIRLDVDSRLPDTLSLGFAFCPSESKIAALLYLMKNAVKPTDLTLIFAPTMHHVEYLQMILNKAGVPCTHLYSSLDSAARKINAAKFQNRIVRVLVTTDIAARGIDIPLLDYVINFNFPSQAKLFVHRAGRVARAGRSGVAFSLVSLEEMGYYVDFHLFLARPLLPISPAGLPEKEDKGGKPVWDGYLGKVHHSVIEDYVASLNTWHKESIDMFNMIKVTKSSHKQYLKSCPAASHESVRRAKAINLETMGIHPCFLDEERELETHRNKMLSDIRSFRPQATVFEIGVNSHSKKSAIMKEKRSAHTRIISKHYLNKEAADTLQAEPVPEEPEEPDSLPAPKKKVKTQKKPAEKPDDEDYFIPYAPKNHYMENELALKNDFGKAVRSSVLDLGADEDSEIRRQRALIKWDRKKKKFVGEEDKNKKIRTESGAWINASYKTNRYDNWRQKTQIDKQPDHDGSDSGNEEKSRGITDVTHKRQGPRPKVKGLREGSVLEFKKRKGGKKRAGNPETDRREGGGKRDGGGGGGKREGGGRREGGDRREGGGKRDGGVKRLQNSRKQLPTKKRPPMKKQRGR